jgi:xanthine/CO dehydrogenase XdhC/CoxF family maturation factor
MAGDGRDVNAPSGGIPQDDELQTALQWLDAGRSVARAAVVATWGSSPRPTGSQMVVDAAGNMAGSVSGGCIEGAVVDAAKQTIKDGKPQMLEFGVTDEQAWEVGLACGGTVHVYVEKME